MRGCRGGVSPCTGDVAAARAQHNRISKKEKKKRKFPSGCKAVRNGNGRFRSPQGNAKRKRVKG